MEIISYLNDRQVSAKTSYRPIKIPRSNRTSTEYAIATTGYFPLNTSTQSRGKAVSIYLDGFIKTAFFFITKRFYLILALCFSIALGIVIPYGISSIFHYSESIVKPITLEYLSPSEIEVLDEAMERFALVASEEIDLAGNILGADISITDINYREPVTFESYTVKAGDTISGISLKFGLRNISTLIGINEISNVRQLRSGQKLTIPSIDGLSYTVKANDTIAGLSVRYDITVEDILDVNDLSSTQLLEGQKLFIPGAKLDETTLKKAMGELFVYPISGNWRLTSKFGSRKDPFTGVPSSHTGIDLAISQGTPIKASMSGKIIAVGFTNVYGNYVIIDHENGYQTLYAHMYKPCPLKKGQRVNQGTQIGQVGNTGYSTGPHLHFTVYKNGKLIDPLTVLK